MRYISEDNKVFNTFEDCEEHEKELKSKQALKNEAEKRKEAKQKEVDKAHAEYEVAKKKYRKVLEEYIKEFDPNWFDLGQALKKLFEF